MRLIQDFMRVAARLAGLREKGQFRQLDEEIREAYTSLLKTDYTLVTGFNDQKWDEYINEKQPEEWEMTATLLMTEGEALADQGNADKADGKLRRALDLFLRCEKEMKTFSIDRNEKIQKLKNDLGVTD